MKAMKYYLPLVFLLAAFSVFAQKEVVRIELDAAINADIYKIVPCGAYGVLVFFETRDLIGEDSKSWLFIHHDKELKEAWKSNIAIVLEADYQGYVLEDSLLFLAFHHTGKVRSASSNFQILTIDLKNGISYESRYLLPDESKLKKMVVRNSMAYLALELKNEGAAVYTVNLKTSETNEFNVVLPDQNFIDDLVYDPYQGRIFFTVSNYLAKKQNKTYLIALTLDGNYDYDMEISTVLGSKYLNTAKICLLGDGRMMLVGSYGSLAARIPSGNEYFGTESTGVYATRIADRSQEFMNYYNFMEFRNLRAGQSARDYYRLSRKKNKEAAEYSVNYELIAHDPEVRDTSIVALFEAFYPEFRTVSDIAYDSWGRPVTHTYSVFEGFRFFNAIIAGFNFNGELLWDNSLEMSIAPVMRLDKRASYYFDGEPVLLYYNDGQKISYRVCLKNAELEPFNRVDLETSNTGDRISDIGYNHMQHWYDQYFLAYGYHTLVNNSRSDREQRTVFYINKIALD